MTRSALVAVIKLHELLLPRLHKNEPDNYYKSTICSGALSIQFLTKEYCFKIYFKVVFCVIQSYKNRRKDDFSCFIVEVFSIINKNIIKMIGPEIKKIDMSFQVVIFFRLNFVLI